MNRFVCSLVLAALAAMAPAAAMAGGPIVWVDIVTSKEVGPSSVNAKMTATDADGACTPKEGLQLTANHDGGIELPASCVGHAVDVAYQEQGWNCTGTTIVENDGEIVLTCD